MNDAHLLHIANATSELMQSLDDHGRFMFVNRAWQERLGYTPEELESLTFLDVIAPEQQAHCSAMFEDMMHGTAPGIMQTVFVSKTGERIPVEGDLSVGYGDQSQRFTVGIFRDIAARDLANGYMHRLFGSLPWLYALINSTGSVASANGQWQSQLGYDPSTLTGAEIGIIAEEEGLQDAIAASSQQVESRTIRARLRSMAGTTHWYDCTLTPTGGEDELVFIGQPVDAIVATESELRFSEERFTGLFDAAPVGIAVTTATGQITAINPAVEAMFGYSLDELRAGGLMTAVHPDWKQHAEDQYREMLLRTGVQPDVERQDNEVVPLLCVAKDGHEVWIVSTSALVMDHGETSAIHVIENITESRRRTAALAEREGRLRQIFDNSPLGIVIVDRENKITSANRAFESMLGFTSDELKGLPLKGTRPLDQPGPNSCRHSRLVAGAITEVRNERPFQRKDGSVFPGRSTWAPVRDQKGEFLYSVRIIEDVSQAQETERLRNEFLSIIGHELRTPLTSVLAVLGLLSTGAMSSETESASVMIETAHRDAHRLKALVDDLLDLQSLSQGNFKLNTDNYDLEDLISQGCAGISDAQHLNIVQSIPQGLTVRADSNRFTQVLLNLIANAAKFSDTGATVTVEAITNDAFAHVSVTDTGVGIPADLLEKIFDRFVQVDSADSRRAGGTGIGLAISQQLVEAQGGTIWAESVIGEGSTFTFTIPTA